VGELAELEVDHDETAQPPVEEDEINSVPLVVESQPPRSAPLNCSARLYILPSPEGLLERFPLSR
jgi:hypothetical protein